VKPYVKTNKNDYVDAEAAGRPTNAVRPKYSCGASVELQ